jgi:rare lipoprotein A
MDGLTAAHRSLPFGTKVRVTNMTNGQTVTVRINDRGPYVGKRIIDLSRGAAQAVNMIRAGVALVRLEILGS